MDQAANGIASALTIEQPAAAISPPALTITALAARWLELANSDDSIREAQQEALETIMHGLEARDRDEALTVTRLVVSDLEADEHPLAASLDAVCRALERDGARDLLAGA